MLSKNSVIAISAVVLVILGTVFMVSRYTRPGDAQGSGDATEDRIRQRVRQLALEETKEAQLKARQSVRAILGDIVVKGGPGGLIPDYVRLTGKLERSAGEIDAAYPVVRVRGTLRSGGLSESVEIVGVDPEFLARMSQRAPSVRHVGSLQPPETSGDGEADEDPPRGMVLTSEVLRESAGRLIGRDVKLLIDAQGRAPGEVGERLFRVGGIVSGLAKNVRPTAFINFYVAREMALKPGSCSEIRIVLKGAQRTDAQIKAIAARVSAIVEQHASGLTAGVPILLGR